jgi:hypothetical protein
VSPGTPLEKARAALKLPAIAEILFPGWEHGAHRHPAQRTENTPPAGVLFRNNGGIWTWHNQHTGESGDDLDFIAKARGCDRREAALWIIAAVKKHAPRAWLGAQAASTKSGKRGGK